MKHYCNKEVSIALLMATEELQCPRDLWHFPSAALRQLLTEPGT
jgi:hypothetical protein